MKWFACVAVALVSVASAAWADVTIGTPFTSGMVLQRDAEVPVWGRATAGEKITVDFAGQSKTTTADESGKWMVKLTALAASAEGRALTVTGSGAPLKLDDVLVGEVWLCAGQSNMGMGLREADGGQAEIDGANDPLLRCMKIRHLSLPRHPSITTTQPATRPGRGPGADAVNDTEPPQRGWMKFAGKEAVMWTGMSYFFGKNLRKELNVPVGLLVTAWGGSTVAAWVPREALDQPPLKGVIAEDIGNYKIHKRPGALYQGMVRPLAPYAVTGGIWYQGESDGEPDQNPYHYRLLMPALITSWRQQFQKPDLPFYVVQLPTLQRQTKWPVVREGQAMAATLPRAGFITTLDIGQVNKLHPTNKKDYADRMAALVLGEVYGKEKLHIPIVAKAEMTGAGANLTFSGTGGELKTSDGQPPRGFELAAADGAFKPAEATISGDAVTVKSAEVPQPVAVRYAWAGDPKANLVNRQNIPAAPYRNDNFPVDGSDLMPAGLSSKPTLAGDEATLKTADAAKGATVEARLRVLEAPAAPNGVTFEVVAGARAYRVGIGRDFVTGLWEKEVRMLASGLDNAAAPHAYRLAIRPDRVAEVYRDGVLIGLIRGEASTAPVGVKIAKTAGSGEARVDGQAISVDVEGAFKP